MLAERFLKSDLSPSERMCTNLDNTKVENVRMMFVFVNWNVSGKRIIHCFKNIHTDEMSYAVRITLALFVLTLKCVIIDFKNQ